MAHRPPHELVHQRVDVADEADGPEPGRDQDDRTGSEREHRDDRCRQRAEGHERYRAGVGPSLARDHERAEEDAAADQRADGEQDQPQVEVLRRHHRRVRGEHHARLSLQHGDIGQQAADQHHHESRPGPARRREARIQQDRRGEIEHRDLEEDDPQQQHVQPVRGQRQIEPVGREQVNGRPARQRDRQAEQPANGQEDDGRDGIGLDQRLGIQVDLESGGWVGAEHGCCHRDTPLPVHHEDFPEHRVVPQSAEFIADDGVLAGRVRRHCQDVLVARMDLHVDVDRLQREPVLQVER